MNARSELARTSPASAPTAAPKAANAAPATRIAARIARIRAQSIVTNSDSPASIKRVTASEATTPRTTFSPRSPVRPTSPRVRRVNAFSSRSSASEPATRSTVTNIRVKVAATAIANVSRLGGDPETTLVCTTIG